MEYILESWSLVVILLSAFVIGWAAEAAQTFLSRALALSILAWLQTLPEFAVEATIAWNQQRDLMIANLTGSLRLLVGLGWPMIFFVHFFFQGVAKRKLVREIRLPDADYASVFFLFASILYFIVILVKGALTLWDSVVLTAIYGAYLWVLLKQPTEAEPEEDEDMPFVVRAVLKLNSGARVSATVLLFAVGGVALYFSAHPFVETLQKWSVAWGMSTFVFVQWVAPFLSEFPEKVTAFNWARQTEKAPMAILNMVSSNINQWTMLAAMIPVVFCLSLGHIEPITFDDMHWTELALTITQSFLGGLLLMDLRFSILDATVIFILWLVQFVDAHLREEVMWAYLAWIVIELAQLTYAYIARREVPRAVVAFKRALQ